MTLLGIETSTAVCSVAVLNDGGNVVERSLVEAHIHSEKLLTLVQEVLTEAGCGVDDIDGIAVSIGPGSFTGLRIGLSSAKGLCYALGKPMVAVPTFNAVASAVARLHPGEPAIVVAVDAKQGDYYYARYTIRSAELVCEEPVAVISVGQLVSKINSFGSVTVATDQVARLSGSISAGIHLVGMTECCHATSVAALGLKQCMARAYADLAAIEPMYLKDFVVRTPVQQEQQATN